MIRKTLLMLLLVAVWVCLAPGDIVYMRNGDKHEGVMREEDGRVFIETDSGVVEVAAEDVVYTSVVAPVVGEPGQSGDGPAGSPEDGQPGAVPLAPPASADDFDGGVVPPAQTFDMDKATMPQSIAFMLMRQAAAAATPRQARALAPQIEQWQAAAHDRQRRIGGKWVRPGDFTLHRQKYERLRAQAEKAARELWAVKDTDENPEEERARLGKVLNGRLTKAAAAWLDDDIRMFLTGVAHYETGSYALAITAFEKCVESQPMVAAYQQGYGLALMEMPGRELDALEACLNELALHPDNSLTLQRVAQAMQNVPGTQVKEDLFVLADEILSEYPDSAFRRSRQAAMIWHMPDDRKGWSSKSRTLPVPSYDSLVYRQGIAVPIGAHTLLLDEKVVRGALEIYILLDNGKIVPAEVVSSSSNEGPQLAMVRTAQAEFEPVAVSEDAQFLVQSGVQSYGLSIFAEMGTAPRLINGKITAAPEPPDEDEEDDDEDEDEDQQAIELDISLAPGEAASPVLTGDRRLVGFLAGRTNFLRDNGGVDEFFPATDFTSLAKTARSSNPKASRLKRRFEPVATEAATFVVYCISSETLD